MNDKYQYYKDQPAKDFSVSTVGSRFNPTPSDIEGPYYKEGAPFKTDLVEQPELHLYGKVRDRDGQPIVNAVLDFWQADADGNYDNVGYHLRGKVRVTTSGWYALRTIEPGNYKISETEYRCSHIHVKVTAPGFKSLTTQLYFKDDPRNATDHWFQEALVIKDGTFDFILERE